MLANRRTAKTKCLITSPITSIKKITAFISQPMGSGRDIHVRHLIQPEPDRAQLAMPEPMTTQMVMIARADVVANAPVAEPAQGNRPNRLQPSTKKNIVHKNGRNLSASW